MHGYKIKNNFFEFFVISGKNADYNWKIFSKIFNKNSKYRLLNYIWNFSSKQSRCCFFEGDENQTKITTFKMNKSNATKLTLLILTLFNLSCRNLSKLFFKETFLLYIHFVLKFVQLNLQFFRRDPCYLNWKRSEICS